MPEYFLILIVLLLVTIILHYHFKIVLFKDKRNLLYFYLIFFVIGILWDTYAILRGHWFYPGKGLVGIYIGIMPLEDYFFIPITSYFGLIIYRLLGLKIKT